MIHKKNTESIWQGDVEALTAAIEALSLNINKNEKGEINRMSKVKVLIEHEDGRKKEFNGDTVICFTVNKDIKLGDGKVQLANAQIALIGNAIPDPIYGRTVGSLIISMVEKSSSGKVMTGFNLHEIAQILEAKSEEIKNSLTESEKDKAVKDALEKYLKAIFIKK